MHSTGIKADHPPVSSTTGQPSETPAANSANAYFNTRTVKRASLYNAIYHITSELVRAPLILPGAIFCGVTANITYNEVSNFLSGSMHFCGNGDYLACIKENPICYAMAAVPGCLGVNWILKPVGNCAGYITATLVDEAVNIIFPAQRQITNKQDNPEPELIPFEKIT